MRSSLLLLSQNARTTAYMRSVLEHAARGAVLDVCSSPVQLRHRLSHESDCLAVAIDEVTIGNALIPFVRHLRTERPGLSIVLLTETPGDETTARGVFAGVDLVCSSGGSSAPELTALLTGGREHPAESGPPVRVLAFNVSRQTLSAMGRSPRLIVTAASEQTLAEPQLSQPADAMLLSATPPEEAVVLAHRLRAWASALPFIVLCDEQSRHGFARLGAAECLAQGCGVEQIEAALTRAVDQARLGTEAALLRSREQRLRSIVESLPEGVMFADPDGVIQAINREALGLCRAESSAAVLGRSLWALFGAANEEAVRTVVAEVTAGRRGETEIIAEDDEARRHLCLRAVPFTREGDERPFILVAMGLRPEPSSSRSEPSSDEPSPGEPPLDERVLVLMEELERERAARSAAEVKAHDLAGEREQLRQEHERERARLLEEREQEGARLQQEAREQERVRLQEEHERERRALQEALAAAQAQLADLTVASGDRDADRRAHAEALAALERTCDDLRAQHRASEQRAAALADAAAARRAENETLQQRLAQAEQERSASEDERRTLRAEAEALRQRIAGLEHERSAIEDDRRAVRADSDALRQRIVELEGERSASEDERRTLRAEAEALRQRIAGLEHERSAIEDDRRAVRADGDALRQRIVELEGERSASEDERRTLRAEGEALRQRIADLERDRAALEEERHARREQAAEIAGLRLARDEERAERERLAVELESIRTALDAASREAEDVRDRLQASEHEHRATLALAEARAQALADASRQVESLADSQKQAREEVATLLVAQAEAATARVDLEAAFARQTAELQRVVHELEPLRAAHAAACSAYISGKRAQSTLEHEIAALRAQLEESRLAAAHAVADAERAHQSRLDWERRAEAAIERRASDDAWFQQRADALMQGRATSDLEWLLGVATIGVMTLRADGRIEHCNDAAARLCGWTDAASALAHGRIPQPLLVLGRPAGDGQALARFDAWIEGFDGTLRRVLGVAAACPPVAGGPRIAWTLVDLGRQAESGATGPVPELEALPHLLTAATNECTALVAQVERAIEGLAPGDGTHLTNVRRGLMRARLVLKQLGSAAHVGGRPPAVFDVAEALVQARTLVTRLAGDEIVTDIAAPEPGLLVAADRTEVDGLLTALVLSGRECLPLGGRLALSAGSLVADVCHAGEVASRPSVVVRASASGYSAQPVVWQQASDLAVHLGGRVEMHHEPAGSSTIEVILPRAVRLSEGGTPAEADATSRDEVAIRVLQHQSDW